MDVMLKLAETAASQIAVYPAVPGKEKCKQWIRKTVLRQKIAPMDPFSWPNALLGEGLLAAFAAAGKEEHLLAVADYLKRWESAGFRIYYVDNIMNGSIALRIEELLENPDIRIRFSDQQTRQLRALCEETAKACADWLRTVPRTGQGIFAYRPQHPNWLFADSLGMICPFLCRYGSDHGDEQMLRLGIGQLQSFLKRGMDRESGLPYHGYDEETGMKYGIIGWGRACGWMLKGLAESLPWIPKEEQSYGELLNAYRKLSASVMECRREDGGFSWQLQAKEGHRDTSAEGMIGMTFIQSLKNGLFQENGQEEEKSAAYSVCLEKTASLKKWIEMALPDLQKRLEESVKNGRLSDCSGECRGFAEYPQIYGCFPWGTGSALAFIAGTRRSG